MKGFRRSKIVVLVLCLAVLGWTAILAAQEAGTVPRGLFEAQGTMRYLDLPTGIVQIDDQRYRLAQNMKWYGLDAEASLMQQLLRSVNRKVAYVVDSEQKAATVNAIWILPEDR
jgi:cytochrome c-type biogenesis protein CcmE